MNKALFIIAGLILLGFTAMLFSSKKSQQSENISEVWSLWKLQNGKSYSTEEDSYRMQIFQMNYQYINWFNEQEGNTYTMGVNQFTDMTNEEFKLMYLGTKVPSEMMFTDIVYETMTESNAVDWRTKGAVQRVKDQGQCGSCWAFSAVAALESYSFIQGKGLGDFSEQQLVDCSKSYGNQGCNGGWMDNAFKYVKDKGIATESGYPYVAYDQTCKMEGGSYKITGYTDIARQCSELQKAVAKQPVSVAVDAANWSSYHTGVFGNCGTSVDHGVLLVGYDDSNNWIIKNSWGSSWGETGYIRLKPGNTCAICNYASYPN